MQLLAAVASVGEAITFAFQDYYRPSFKRFVGDMVYAITNP